MSGGIILIVFAALIGLVAGLSSSRIRPTLLRVLAGLGLLFIVGAVVAATSGGSLKMAVMGWLLCGLAVFISFLVSLAAGLACLVEALGTHSPDRMPGNADAGRPPPLLTSRTLPSSSRTTQIQELRVPRSKRALAARPPGGTMHEWPDELNRQDDPMQPSALYDSWLGEWEPAGLADGPGGTEDENEATRPAEPSAHASVGTRNSSDPGDKDARFEQGVQGRMPSHELPLHTTRAGDVQYSSRPVDDRVPADRATPAR